MVEKTISCSLLESDICVCVTAHNKGHCDETTAALSVVLSALWASGQVAQRFKILFDKGTSIHFSTLV